MVTIKGLTHEEGNRQIQVETKNAEGAGSVSSEWRRHAKLILTVPKCQGVGVQGALGGFRVHSLEAPLMVQGGGNRDYQARYEVTNLDGPLTTVRHPDPPASTASRETSRSSRRPMPRTPSTSHGPDGVTMRPVAPPESSYKDIQGNLHARFCRADPDPGGDRGAGGCRERIRQDRLAFRPAHRRHGPPHRLAERAHRGAVLARRAGQAPARALHRVRRHPAAPGQQRPPVPDVPRQHGRRDQPLVARLLLRQAREIASATSRPCSSASPPPCGAIAARRAIDIISRAGTVTYEPIAGAAAGR